MSEINSRSQQILEYIQKNEQATVTELTKVFGVSDMPVRRDLNKLQRSGKIIKFHGGARRNDTSLLALEDDYSKRTELYSEEKRLIGNTAVELIKSLIGEAPDSSTVFFGQGTTVLETVSQLDDMQNSLIVTDNILCAEKLARDLDNQIITTGGILNRTNFNTIGWFAEQMIRNFSIDLAVISLSAMDAKGGLYTYIVEETGLYSSIINASQHVLLLMDHSKIKARGRVFLCKMDEKFTMVTEEGITEKDLKELKKTKARIIVSGH